MRILLAGATGVLGRLILPRLLADGHQVTALTRQPERVEMLQAAGADPRIVDVFDRDRVHRLLVDARPEVVMHQLTDLSGGNSGSNARLRTIGTRNLVDAALSVGVAKIVAQSVAWAYEPGDTPATEATPLDHYSVEPRATTIRGIAALEDAVTALPAWVVLRYGLLYGAGTWYSPDGMMGDSARHGDLQPTADINSFVHVNDAADAAVAALEWPTGAVNICDDDPAAGTEWVPAFYAWAGASQPDVLHPVAPRRQGQNSWARGANNAFARHDRGWSPAHASWREHFATQPVAP